MEETERKTVMDRLRGPPVLKAGNKQQTDPVRFYDGISHKKGMTMNLKNKKIYLALCIIINLSILGYLKYTNFIISIINALSQNKIIELTNIVLPL